MILPLRVLGRAVGEADVVGLGQGADFLADVVASVPAASSSLGSRRLERDEHGHGLALQFVRAGRPRPPRPPRGWLTSALSISIVLSRWPATFSTSSMRPMIQ